MWNPCGFLLLFLLSERCPPNTNFNSFPEFVRLYRVGKCSLSLLSCFIYLFNCTLGTQILAACFLSEQVYIICFGFYRTRIVNICLTSCWLPVFWSHEIPYMVGCLVEIMPCRFEYFDCRIQRRQPVYLVQSIQDFSCDYAYYLPPALLKNGIWEIERLIRVDN